MNEDKAINKAIFWYWVQREIGNGKKIDFEDYMNTLWNFFKAACESKSLQLGSIVNFKFNDGKCFFDEKPGCIDNVKKYLKQFENNNFEALNALSNDDINNIRQLVDLFAKYYRLYVQLDEKCERQLKKQAIFFFGIQLGLSRSKYADSDGPLYIDDDVPEEIYQVLRRKIRSFIISCYIKSVRLRKPNILEKNNFSSVIPYRNDNGRIELVDCEIWDKKVIEYLTKLQHGDYSIYDEFKPSEIRELSELSELFLKLCHDEIGYSDGDYYESKSAHRFVS